MNVRMLSMSRYFILIVWTIRANLFAVEPEHAIRSTYSNGARL